MGIQDRPIVLKRFVNGAEAEAFFQKRAPDKRPPWLRTVVLSFPSGRTAEEVVVNDSPGLAWIVNLGCIELHPHPVRSGDLDHPDELRTYLWRYRLIGMSLVFRCWTLLADWICSGSIELDRAPTAHHTLQDDRISPYTDAHRSSPRC